MRATVEAGDLLGGEEAELRDPLKHVDNARRDAESLWRSFGTGEALERGSGRHTHIVRTKR